MSAAAERPDHRVTILQALAECTSKIKSVLANARDILAVLSLEEFISEKLGMMFGLCFSYSQLFERIDVKNRKSLEVLIQRHSRFPEVIQNYEQLIAAEESWDRFLEDMDKRIAVEDNTDPANVGDMGPVQLELERVHDGEKKVPKSDDTSRSGEKSALFKRNPSFRIMNDMLVLTIVPEIEAIPADVVVISFGQRNGALLWAEDVHCAFPMLLDPERKVYRFLGLKKSVYKVWATQTLTYYAEQVRAGRELPKAYAEVEDDVYQLGGDFVLDKGGKILLLYRSEMANDRPTVDQLITACCTKRPVTNFMKEGGDLDLSWFDSEMMEVD